jgi:hypothetical protein
LIIKELERSRFDFEEPRFNLESDSSKDDDWIARLQEGVGQQPVTCFGFIADLALSLPASRLINVVPVVLGTTTKHSEAGLESFGLPFKYSLDPQLIIVPVYFCRNDPGPVEAHDESLTAIVWQLLV